MNFPPNLLEKIREEFSEKIDKMFSSKDSLSLNIEFNGELKRTTDKCYRQLKALMETLDSNLDTLNTLPIL